MNAEQDHGLVRRAAVHAALGDPGRLAIVDALLLGEASPSELQRLLAMPSNLLAHHVRVLEQVGVLSRHRSEADRRRTYLALVPAAFDVLRPMKVHDAVRVVFVCTHNSALPARRRDVERHEPGPDDLGGHPPRPRHPSRRRRGGPTPPHPADPCPSPARRRRAARRRRRADPAGLRVQAEFTLPADGEQIGETAELGDRVRWTSDQKRVPMLLLDPDNPDRVLVTDPTGRLLLKAMPPDRGSACLGGPNSHGPLHQVVLMAVLRRARCGRQRGRDRGGLRCLPWTAGAAGRSAIACGGSRR